MADELDLELEEAPESEEVSKAEKRIKNLSEKVKLTSQERDDLAKAKSDLEAEKAKLTKEADFYKNFTKLSTKYPNATEYQDKILEKYNAGYDPEDATVAILAKEGKLNPQPMQVAPTESPAGGSAINTLKTDGEKTPANMTQAERLAELGKNEAELQRILNPNHL